MSQETKPKQNHLSLTTLRRALHQTEESLEARQSVWHMLETCEVCRQAEPLIYQSFEAGLLPLDASLPEIETLVLEARGACRWRKIVGDGGPWDTLRGDERLAEDGGPRGPGQAAADLQRPHPRERHLRRLRHP